MKRTVAVILCMILLLPLLGCELQRERSWQEKVDSIEVGMTVVELFDLMGEPDAYIGSGAVNPMYYGPDQQVVIVCVRRDYTQEDDPFVVTVKPVTETYEDFKERWGKYPDDPSAWWNAE